MPRRTSLRYCLTQSTFILSINLKRERENTTVRLYIRQRTVSFCVDGGFNRSEFLFRALMENHIFKHKYLLVCEEDLGKDLS